MNNADKPKNGEDLIHSFNSTDYSEGYFKGLTKREYFAGLAMQSLAGLEKQNSESHSIDVAKRVAVQSVYFADELLKQLETTQAD